VYGDTIRNKIQESIGQVGMGKRGFLGRSDYPTQNRKGKSNHAGKKGKLTRREDGKQDFKSKNFQKRREGNPELFTTEA